MWSYNTVAFRQEDIVADIVADNVVLSERNVTTLLVPLRKRAAANGVISVSFILKYKGKVLNKNSPCSLYNFARPCLEMALHNYISNKTDRKLQESKCFVMR